MSAPADPIGVFGAAAPAAFSYLTSEWGFAACGPPSAPEDDPRDQLSRQRFVRGDRIIDVGMTHIVLALYVLVADRWPGTGKREDSCAGWKVATPVSFEEYLLAKHGGEIGPPLEGMGQLRTFSALSEKNPGRYTKVVVPRLVRAIGVLAQRFRTFGRELAEGDLSRIRRTLPR